MVTMPYNWVVNKGPLADYFEQNWLKYQLAHGKNTQKEMASVLGLPQGFFNELMAGRKTNVKYHVALYIANVFQDDEILDILGYDRPVDPLPAKLTAALESAKSKIVAAGVSGDSPEAQAIIIEAMNAAGYKLISTDDNESTK